MKLWKKWCKAVEKHNEPLLQSWATSDETWNPYEIFIPIIAGLILFFSAAVISALETGFSLWLSTIMFLFGFIVSGLFMFVNWRAYS